MRILLMWTGFLRVCSVHLWNSRAHFSFKVEDILDVAGALLPAAGDLLAPHPNSDVVVDPAGLTRDREKIRYLDFITKMETMFKSVLDFCPHLQPQFWMFQLGPQLQLGPRQCFMRSNTTKLHSKASMKVWCAKSAKKEVWSKNMIGWLGSELRLQNQSCCLLLCLHKQVKPICADPYHGF